MAPDLYVPHVHGGSFANAERRALIARNLRVLEARHGNYHADVRRFFAADPARPLRAAVLFRILAHEAGSDFEIIVDHELGGGAMFTASGCGGAGRARAPAARVTAARKTGAWRFLFRHEGNDYGFRLPAWDHFDVLVPGGTRVHWVLNSAVGMARAAQCLDYLAGASGAAATGSICLHDYYPVCPSTISSTARALLRRA
jgi:hypothetical protein